MSVFFSKVCFWISMERMKQSTMKAATVAVLVFFMQLCFSQNRISQQVHQYNGMRMMNDTYFYVRTIAVSLTANGCISVECRFNAALDPRSVTPNKILVNGKPLSATTKVLFNKAGTQLRFTLPNEISQQLKDTPFSLELADAASFDKTALSYTIFDGLLCGHSYTYAKPQEGAK